MKEDETEIYERVAVIKYIYGTVFPMVRFLDSIDYENGFFGRCYRNPSMSSMKRLERVMQLMAVSVKFDGYDPIITAFRLFTPTSFSVAPEKEVDWMDAMSDDDEERNEGHPGHPSEYGDN